jgi:hypothetical protein
LDEKNGFEFIHQWMQHVPDKDKQGQGSGFGFKAVHKDWGQDSWVEIEAVNIYYSK